MVFNSNMATKLEFQVAVEDRFAQKSIDVYRGFVQLYTDASQLCQQTLFRKPTDATNSDSSGKVKHCFICDTLAPPFEAVISAVF